MAEEILSQLERAIAIRDMLSGEEWTTRPRIAAELGVDVKTVGRYIKALKRMDYHIVSARGKGLRLEENFCEGQLLLSEEELYALFLSLAKSADQFPQRVVVSLKRRLINQLSQSAREKVEPITSDRGGDGKVGDLAVLRDIFTALGGKRLLRIAYRGLKDSETQSRRVAPLRFVCVREAWYLEAYDVDKAGERNFRLDRVRGTALLQEKFLTPEKHESFAHHPWDFGNEATTVVLSLKPGLADWLRENPAHPSQILQQVADGTTRCTFTVKGREKFIDWLMSLRGFRLEGPPDYRSALSHRATTISAEFGTFDTAWEVSNVGN